MTEKIVKGILNLSGIIRNSKSIKNIAMNMKIIIDNTIKLAMFKKKYW